MEVPFVQKLIDTQSQDYEDACEGIIQFEDKMGDIIKHTEISFGHSDALAELANDFYNTSERKNMSAYTLFLNSVGNIQSYTNEITSRLTKCVVEPQLKILALCSQFKERMKARKVLLIDFNKLFTKLKKKEEDGSPLTPRLKSFENAYDELRLFTTELVIDLRAFLNVRKCILNNFLLDLSSMLMNYGDQMGVSASKELPYVLTALTEGQKEEELDDLLCDVENVLNDDLGMKFFKLHLEAEYSVENLYFYLHVKKYKELSAPERKRKPSEEFEIDARAREIFDLYFDPDSYNQINIDSSLLQMITDRIEKNEIAHNMFDEAVEEIIALMGRDSFERFKHGEIRDLYEVCYKRKNFSFWKYYAANGEFEFDFPDDYLMLRFSDPIILPTIENPNPSQTSINEMERLKRKEEWKAEEAAMLERMRIEKERIQEEKERLKEEKERMKAEKREKEKEEKERLRKEREEKKEKDKERQEKERDKERREKETELPVEEVIVRKPQDEEKHMEQKHIDPADMGGVRLLANDDLISAHRSLRRVDPPPIVTQQSPRGSPRKKMTKRSESFSGSAVRRQKKRVEKPRRPPPKRIASSPTLKKPSSKPPVPSKYKVRRRNSSEPTPSGRGRGKAPPAPPSLSRVAIDKR